MRHAGSAATLIGGVIRAELAEGIAAGVLRVPGSRDSSRGVPAEVLRGSGRAKGHRRREIEWRIYSPASVPGAGKREWCCGEEVAMVWRVEVQGRVAACLKEGSGDPGRACPGVIPAGIAA